MSDTDAEADTDSPTEPEPRRGLPPWVLAVGLLVVVAGGALWLWSTSRSDGSSPAGDGAVAEQVGGRQRLEGFGEVTITITSSDGDEHEACLLLAESSSQRQRGLMEVTDSTLGGYDGMLFDFDGETMSGFWMRNTPMPLSIAFFGSSGALVSTADMAACGDQPTCPTYDPAGTYHYAIEVPRGRLGQLAIEQGARLTVGPSSCPPA